ncbi:MAG: DUF367 family protein [Promethearchaeota archaeon]
MGVQEESGSSERNLSVKLHVLHLNQCDPRKCTAKRLKKHGLVRLHKTFKTVPLRSVKLNPFAKETIGPGDAGLIKRFGLTVIDCSWKKAQGIFSTMSIRNGRKLPIDFLAGNSINYTMPGKLSSVEALAAALIMTGFKADAEFILSKFRWGHTFLDLNHDLIEECLQNSREHANHMQNPSTGLQ